MVPKVADKWRDIGVHLLDPTLINDRVLDVIEANYPRSVEKCCKCVFEKWLRQKEDVSWNQLIKTIYDIGLNNLASQLEKGLIGNMCIYIQLSVFSYTLNRQRPSIESLHCCKICDQIYKNRSKLHNWQVPLFITNQVL